MAGENTGLLDSEVDDTSLESAVETDAATDTQSSDAATSEASPEKDQAAVEKKTDTQGTNFEQRFRDTQRSLSKIAEENKILKAQMDAIRGIAPALNRQHNEPDEAQQRQQIERLQEDIRNDPGKVVDYIHSLMQARDQYWQGHIANLHQDFEGRLLSQTPEYGELREIIDDIKQQPYARFMQPGEIVDLAKRTSAKAAARPTPRPQGGIGSGGARRAQSAQQSDPPALQAYWARMGLTGDSKDNNSLLG